MRHRYDYLRWRHNQYTGEWFVEIADHLTGVVYWERWSKHRAVIEGRG